MIHVCITPVRPYLHSVHTYKQPATGASTEHAPIVTILHNAADMMVQTESACKDVTL